MCMAFSREGGSPESQGAAEESPAVMPGKIRAGRAVGENTARVSGNTPDCYLLQGIRSRGHLAWKHVNPKEQGSQP
jgi:hypothetical protein